MSKPARSWSAFCIFVVGPLGNCLAQTIESLEEGKTADERKIALINWALSSFLKNKNGWVQRKRGKRHCKIALQCLLEHFLLVRASMLAACKVEAELPHWPLAAELSRLCCRAKHIRETFGERSLPARTGQCCRKAAYQGVAESGVPTNRTPVAVHQPYHQTKPRPRGAQSLLGKLSAFKVLVARQSALFALPIFGLVWIWTPVCRG